MDLTSSLEESNTFFVGLFSKNQAFAQSVLASAQVQYSIMNELRNRVAPPTNVEQPLLATLISNDKLVELIIARRLSSSKVPSF